MYLEQEYQAENLSLSFAAALSGCEVSVLDCALESLKVS